MKKIVRALPVSRNTVRKILRSDETDFSYDRDRQPMWRIGPWQLEQFLSANANEPSRERLTLIRIFEELYGLGYEGGYDDVRRFAKGWAQNRGAVTAEAYVPLHYAPGEAYQFDSSDEVVVVSAVAVTVRVAHVRFPAEVGRRVERRQNALRAPGFRLACRAPYAKLGSAPRIAAFASGRIGW